MRLTVVDSQLKRYAALTVDKGIINSEDNKFKEIKNDVIVLQIDDNVKITIDKAMVYPSASDAVESGNDIKNNPNPN